MAYSADLELRIRKIVGRWKGVTSKKMFGGTAHLLNGNMLAGVYKNFLIVRLGEKRFEKAMKNPSAKVMDITGKPMKGWIMVSAEGYGTDSDLKSWIEIAKEFVKTLPKK